MPSRGRRRRRGLAALVVVGVVAGGSGAAGMTLGAGGSERHESAPGPEVAEAPSTAERRSGGERAEPRPTRGPGRPRVEWRDSEALGLPGAGRLTRGVKLPATGSSLFTWDPIQRESPNREWRRWGTDELVRTTLRVVREYAAAHPNAPRVGIGDLSRPHGGDFGPRYGLPGHASHQNGLDADVYYPRRDRRERPPTTVPQVDQRLSQELVDRFVAAGAEKVLVGPNTSLTGPPDIVVPYANHDNHLHVRLPA